MRIEGNEKVLQCALQSSPPISSDCYMISMKHVINGEMAYGRSKFDFNKGTLLFGAPNKSVEWDSVSTLPKGFTITFHKDFLKRHPLFQKIQKFGFFDYTVNEALHLSPKEEIVMNGLFTNIEVEYHNNQDDFSREIIISHIDTFLNYCERYYKRQFLNRTELNSTIYRKFKNIMFDYVESKKIKKESPKIDWIAEELGVSHRYLNDMLKAETGKTAVDNINLFLIDISKNRLLEPNSSISEVAYNLGFEYPQYFSRMFKKKTGLSPKAFILENQLN